MSKSLRVFVASAADYFTDHAPHGEGLIAWHLFSALAARGHELVICTRAADLRSDPPFEVIEVGRSSGWESLEPIAYSFKVTSLFNRLGGADRFDAMHWLFPQGSPPATPSQQLPFVIGPHSSTWADRGQRRVRPGDFVRQAVFPLERELRYRALRRATAILASTPAARDEIPARFRAKVSIVPFGVDIERFRVAPPPAAPTLLFLGSLERKKGVHDLIEAFVRVAAAMPSARLILAGAGPERSRVEARVAELGLVDRVELLGRYENIAVPELLLSASLVCLPSHGEPFGMAVLEAMAAGRAVVAVDEGGPRFLVDRNHGGRLVPRQRPDMLAETLLELLSDRELLGRMGRFNRERAEDEFALARVVESLEHLYRPELATMSIAPVAARGAT